MKWIVGYSVFIALQTAAILYMSYRNNRVYKFRMMVLNASTFKNGQVVPYNSLPSYDEMLWRFWIWNLEKFLPFPIKEGIIKNETKQTEL